MLARSDEFVAMLKYQSKNASVLPEHVAYELSSESFSWNDIVRKFASSAESELASASIFAWSYSAPSME